MPKRLPPNPSIAQLKKQAKDLLQAYRGDSHDAYARIAENYPKLSGASPEAIANADLCLQDAQLVTAREYGFGSWPKLRAFLASDLADVAQALTGDGVDLVRQVAPMHTPVLILGETGSGKERVARAIHETSPRGDGPFVAFDCGSPPEALATSLLLGYVAGAFTGAVADRAGALEEADGGSLYLDTVSALDARAQVNLLRAIDEGESQRIGSARSVAVDVRVIAAAGDDFAVGVETGSMRRDLYDCLNTVSIRLVPLRARQGDIPALVDHFIQRSERSTGKSIRGMSPDALDVLQGHDFPGNVRELRSVVEHACVRCSGQVIEPGDMPPELAPRAGV